MSIFRLPFKSVIAWDVNQFPKPWSADCSAIYTFIKENIKPGQSSLSEEAQQLPDDEKVFGKNLRWVSGGLDGVFGHHVDSSEQKELAKKVYVALENSVKNPSGKNISDFYQLLLNDNTLGFIDHFLRFRKN